MKVITNLRDLEEFGIYPLTSEACGLAMRVLCDFDERGRLTLADWLGLDNFRGVEPWNRQTAGREHVGAVMLTPEAALGLGVFCLLRHGHKVVVLLEHDTDSLRRTNELHHALGGVLTALEHPGGEALRVAVEAARAAHAHAPPYQVSSWLGVGALYGFTLTEGETPEYAEHLAFVQRYPGLRLRVFVPRGVTFDMDHQGKRTPKVGGLRNEHVSSGRTT